MIRTVALVPGKGRTSTVTPAGTRGRGAGSRDNSHNDQGRITPRGRTLAMPRRPSSKLVPMGNTSRVLKNGFAFFRAC